MATKPTKKIVKVVCSVCDQPWDDHKEKTLEECVRLLKVALARRPATTVSTMYGTQTYPPATISPVQVVK